MDYNSVLKIAPNPTTPWSRLKVYDEAPLCFLAGKAHNQGDISKIEGQTLLPPPHIRPFNFGNASL
jgi:hypothetical protein